MNTDSNKLSKPESLEELVQDMETNPNKYQHLQIFLRREDINDFPNFGEEFLAVTKDGFELYRVENVDYQNGRITLSLTETSTNTSVKHTIDIFNEHPSCIFIRWKDVKSMVFDECMKSNRHDNELLELTDDKNGD